MKFAVNALIWTTESITAASLFCLASANTASTVSKFPCFTPQLFKRSRSVELWRRTNWNALSARSFPRA